MEKTLIIIGGGIAGLSAGCYAQMNGFASTIYEMHNVPGGLCTAWKRKNFTFDLCIEWLAGSSPKSRLHAMWEELGAIQGRQFLEHEYLNQALDEHRNRFISYTDPDRLREHMLSFSLEDELLITEITDDIRTMMDLEMPDPVLMELFGKYAMSASELASRFKNPVMSNLFRCAFDWHGMSVIVPLWTLSLMGSGNAGYPIGGSRPFANAIKDRYCDLGGTISFGSRIEKILVEDDVAVGIRLDDGTEKRGDIVLSAADGYTTIFKWLDGRYVDDTIRGHYETLEPYPPLVFVSVGVNGDYSGEPHWMLFVLKRPIEVGGDEVKLLWLLNHSADKSLAPQGKTVFSLMIPTNYDYWASFENKTDDYIAEKKKIKEATVNAIAELYPEIVDHVEVVDVATPLTFVRYTGNWRGSYQGWLLTRKSLPAQLPSTLPGLANFYMAGHWVSTGGGLPAAAMTARAAVKLACENENKPFVTTKPQT
jgi:phytoene dehydrogenase-like protein